MKIYKLLITTVLCLGLMFGSSSCVVINTKHDKGLHKGWYKPKKGKKPHKHHHKHEHKEKKGHDKHKGKKGHDKKKKGKKK